MSVKNYFTAFFTSLVLVASIHVKAQTFDTFAFTQRAHAKAQSILGKDFVAHDQGVWFQAGASSIDSSQPMDQARVL